MNEYPKMLYRAGGPEEIHGGQFATRIVHDQAEEVAALADGWSVTTTEALEYDQPETGSTLTPTGAPTRDEMKRKAAELGLTFKHNISNAALGEMIDAALAPKE